VDGQSKLMLVECEFQYICDIKPLRGVDGSIRLFAPQTRYRNVRNLPLNKYGEGSFCKFQIPKTYRNSGVYVLKSNEGVRYVGECVNLSARFNIGYGTISPRNCFKGGQETNCRLNMLIYLAAQAQDSISLWFFQTADYKALEARLRSELNPPWNHI
jgi:hypothetical protein